MERARVERFVEGFALQKTVDFELFAEGPLNESAVNKESIVDALEEFSANASLMHAGRFVRVQIVGTDGDIWIDLIVNQTQSVADVHPTKILLDRTRAEQNPVHTKSLRFDGVLHVLVDAPLRNSKGETVAFIQGLYRISDIVMASLKKERYFAVGSTIITVCVVLLVLYPIIRQLFSELLKLAGNLMSANLDSSVVLGNAIAKRDNETNEHNYRVTLFSVRTAEEMNLPEKEIARLLKGAFIHDVGKIAIPDNILLKPGKLDDVEYTLMRTHVNEGVDVVNDVDWFDDAMDVIRCHHEKFDGTGYPNGLKGDEIPIIARIFSVTDVFDALISDRPYKKGFSYEESMQIIRDDTSTHFDPKVVDVFETISKGLYDELIGKDTEYLSKRLAETLQKYYSL
jgi:HD-GYP domain-containing protein (c-di-GMP phosphodiesterase class II)